MAEKKKETVEATEELTFTKEQIVGSTKFSKYKDLLNGNLQNGQSYSISEVEALIDEFMKGQVK